jgi:site-specific DNA recombinase
MLQPILPNSPASLQSSPQAPRLAAVYVRVSTTDQADHGFSLPTQREACLRFAQHHGYTVLEEYIFSDDYTGTALRRPSLTTLRELVRHRQIQSLVIYDIDRLSRKLAHQLLLSDELERHNVTLLVATMPNQEKNPETQLLINVKGVLAEYEREKMLERTSSLNVS